MSHYVQKLILIRDRHDVIEPFLRHAVKRKVFSGVLLEDRLGGDFLLHDPGNYNVFDPFPNFDELKSSSLGMNLAFSILCPFVSLVVMAHVTQ